MKNCISTLGVFAIPVAWGLSRYNINARSWTVLCLWLNVAGSPVVLVMLVLKWTTVGGWVSQAITVGLIVNGWMLWVLYRPNVRELFERGKPPITRQEAVQFGLRHVYLVFFIAALVFVRLKQNDVVYVYKQRGSRFGGVVWRDGRQVVETLDCLYIYREYRFRNSEPLVDSVVFIERARVFLKTQQTQILLGIRTLELSGVGGRRRYLYFAR